jgi:ribosome-binding protein aMBF1 (putative translation factor)
MTKMKCKICTEEKDEELDFYVQKGAPMGRCKECHKEYMRKWYIINRAKMHESRVKYHNSKYRTKKMAEAQAKEPQDARTQKAG